MNENPAYTLRQLTLYFLQLGYAGFGGPVALVGYMHRDLVDKNQWISEEEYREGMTLAQLAPGPLAAQLSIYLGYVHYGIWGATLTGFAFVLPSFLMVLGLGIAYQHFGGLPWIQAIFYGVGAGVIGIIALSSYKLTQKSLKNDRWLWSIFVVICVITFITEQEILWVILLAGLLYWLVKFPPKITSKAFFLLPLGIFPVWVPESKLVQIAWFFTKAGAFVFGSGLAIVPFLYGGVVKEYQWLNEQQFVDAVAVAMITPGPVVITVGFIGFLAEGFSGACVAALATFLPCYVFTILFAPYLKKYGRNPQLKAFVNGITAAAVGAIAGSVLVLGKRTLNDVPTWTIAILAVVTLYQFKKIKELHIIGLAALAGIVLKLIIA
jgi:chromate transporter